MNIDLIMLFAVIMEAIAAVFIWCTVAFFRHVRRKRVFVDANVSRKGKYQK